MRMTAAKDSASGLDDLTRDNPATDSIEAAIPALPPLMNCAPSSRMAGIVPVSVEPSLPVVRTASGASAATGRKSASDIDHAG